RRIAGRTTKRNIRIRNGRILASSLMPRSSPGACRNAGQAADFSPKAPPYFTPKSKPRGSPRRILTQGWGFSQPPPILSGETDLLQPLLQEGIRRDRRIFRPGPAAARNALDDGVGMRMHEEGHRIARNVGP